jgi:hypothetical protein
MLTAAGNVCHEYISTLLEWTVPTTTDVSLFLLEAADEVVSIGRADISAGNSSCSMQTKT